MILNQWTQRHSLWAVLLLAVASASGCSGQNSEQGSEGPDFSNMVPVNGVITLNGEPLAGAVVTFLPKQWAPGVGETNDKGEYNLSTSGRDGLPPGEYKVAISLLLSAEGEPQGIGPRSSLAQPPSMLTAKEFLPKQYADLGSSKLTAVVGNKGGSFNFNVEAPGLVLPPRPEPESQAKEKVDEPATKTEDKPAVEPATPAKTDAEAAKPEAR